MSRTDRRDAKEKHKDRILQLLSHREPDSVLCGDLNGKEIRKREDVCVCIAGPFCCIAETNTTLESNYMSTKIKIISWST